MTALNKRRNSGEESPKLVVSIPKPDIKVMSVKIKNMDGSSLISHRFSDKAKNSIIKKQLKEATRGHEKKDPQELFEACIHYTEDGKPGYRADGLKKAMVNAADIVGIKMTQARKAFFVVGDVIPFSKYSKPVMREDFPRIATGNPDWRIRAEFHNWEMNVSIRYNAHYFSADQIINLLSNAGFHCGIGDWRPSAPKSSGNHGMFEIIN